MPKKKSKNAAKPSKLMSTEERVPTGIAGFDELVQGGFPRGRIILLSGTPGTGKTIFAMEYLYNGAVKHNEKGMFITIEERVDSLKAQAKRFGWDLDKLERNGMLKIMRLDVKNIKGLSGSEIMDYAIKNNIKRLAIDSLSALAINTPTIYTSAGETLSNVNVMRFIYSFINDLRDDAVTTLLISQTQGEELSRDSVSEFTCDGIIYIKYESLGGEYSRALVVRKLRETHHDADIHPLEMRDNVGLVVHKLG